MTALPAGVLTFGGGTSAELLNLTAPVPAGVMTIATDTGIIKVGDGTTMYSSLPVLVTLATLTNLSSAYAQGVALTSAATASAAQANAAATAAGAAANTASASAANAAGSAAAAVAETSTVSSSIAALSGQIAALGANAGSGSGGATAAGQASALTVLTEIENNTTGVATAENQTLALSALSTIATAVSATGINTGSVVAEFTTNNNILGSIDVVLGSISAQLAGTLDVKQMGPLPAGTNTIGATTSPPSTFMGVMTVSAAASEPLVAGGNVTLSPNSASLPVAGAFGNLTVINTGTNPAYVSWFGGTAGTSDGCEELAPGASDTLNLTGSEAAPSFYSTAGTTLAFHN